jgi:hypothetical protein
MRRITTYSFIISLVWLGMIIASGFLAAHTAYGVYDPTWKQQVELSRITLVNSVHRAEWACCALSWVLLLRSRVVRERNALLYLGVVTIMVALQSAVFIPGLTAAARAGHSATVFISMGQLGSEMLKALALALLSSAQIQSFARAIISE